MSLSPPGKHRHGCVAIAVASAMTIAIPSAAQADRGDYVARSIVEAANPGLPVSGPLADFRAVSGARVIVPTAWKHLRATAGQLRFITPGRICRYRVTFTLASRLAVPGDAAVYAASALPS